MGNALYAVSLILVFGWLLGFFAFHSGSMIHLLLLIIAVIIIVVRIIEKRRLL